MSLTIAFCFDLLLNIYKVLTTKPTRCTNFSNLFFEWNSTCFGQSPCPSSGVQHCRHRNRYMSYSKQSANLYDIYPFLCEQCRTPDDGQRDCPKYVDFHSKKKFEKLVHLVGFVIRMYHDARSSECQNIHGCCNANFMNISNSKIRVIAFAREPNVLHNTYKFWDSALTHTNSTKDAGVKLDSKLHFLAHVGYIFSQSVKVLGLMRTMTCSFPTLDIWLILYVSLIRLKLECATGIRNCVMSTDYWQLERPQRKFRSLCQDHLFTSVHVTSIFSYF